MMTPSIVHQSELEEAVHSLAWSPDGAHLLATPMAGNHVVLNAAGDERIWKGDTTGNGSPCWKDSQNALLPDSSGSIRIHSLQDPTAEKTISLGKGWVEKCCANVDRTMIGVSCGKQLFLYDNEGQLLKTHEKKSGSICDFAWNPAGSREFVLAGNGGLQFERVGENKAFAVLEWPGASLKVLWSRDGRWTVTADQTPSIHLYDHNRGYPLHIQGYPIKVRCLAMDYSSRYLATGGGSDITLWQCTGKTGPEGTTPLTLQGHMDECLALAFHPKEFLLASGGRDSVLCFHHPGKSKHPSMALPLPSEVTTLEWNPGGRLLAAGCSDGSVHIINPF
jgi:WD40 repeat protein